MILSVPKYFYNIFCCWARCRYGERYYNLLCMKNIQEWFKILIWLKAQWGRAGKLYSDQAEEKPGCLSKWAMSSLLLIVVCLFLVGSHTAYYKLVWISYVAQLAGKMWCSCPLPWDCRKAHFNCLLKSICGREFHLTLQFRYMSLSHRGKLWYRLSSLVYSSS